MKSFESLGLSRSILRALEDAGYSQPTPIQEQAIPSALAGDNIIATAQTGTGKTAAFVLPMIQDIIENPSREVKALILAPTRELANQISLSIREYSKYARMRHAVVFGGVSMYEQIRVIRRGVDVIVATPGRLIDLYEQGIINMDFVRTLVLDEADRMLDMGFIHDIRKVVSWIPEERQTLFFSATMPKEVKALATDIVPNPMEIHLDPGTPAALSVDQEWFMVRRDRKRTLLEELLESKVQGEQVIIFTKTKRGADRVEEDLRDKGYRVGALHGNKSQHQRNRILGDFQRNKSQVLVATDVASRGIDIDNLPWVFNYDMPQDAETYIHRIGRTGRAGATGIAVSFCDEDDGYIMKAIEKHISKTIDRNVDHPHVFTVPQNEDKPEFKQKKNRRTNFSHRNSRKPGLFSNSRKSGEHGSSRGGDGHGSKAAGAEGSRSAGKKNNFEFSGPKKKSIFQPRTKR